MEFTELTEQWAALLGLAALIAVLINVLKRGRGCEGWASAHLERRAEPVGADFVVLPEDLQT